MNNPKHEKQYFTSLEDIYKLRFNALLATAHKYIFNHDFAIDAVHDAFVKAQEYHIKKPGRNFREQILHVHVIRACHRINKRFSREIPSGLMGEREVVEEI